MKKIMLGWVVGALVFLLVGGSVQAMMPSPISLQEETHNYTYIVDEEGRAQVWLSVFQGISQRTSYEYRLGLPAEVEGVVGWYRESGCKEERVLYGCVNYTNGTWKQIEVKRDGEEVVIVVPKSEVAASETNPRQVMLGLRYESSTAMKKRWWGRELALTTARPVSSQYVNIGMGVELPDGVYARDDDQGPENWGEISAELSMMAQPNEKLGVMSPEVMFDRAGIGAISKWKDGVLMDQEYTWNLMTATSRWKLYHSELGKALLVVMAIAVVLSLLLSIVIGRKAWWWYLSVVSLILLLGGLVMALVVGYNMVFGRGGGGYPVMLDSQRSEVQLMDSGADVEEMGESVPMMLDNDVSIGEANY